MRLRAAFTSRPSSRRSSSSRRFFGRVVCAGRRFFSGVERFPGRGFDGGREVLSRDGLRGADGRSVGLSSVRSDGRSEVGVRSSVGAGLSSLGLVGAFGGAGASDGPGLFFLRRFLSMSPSRSATLPMKRPTPSMRNS